MTQCTVCGHDLTDLLNTSISSTGSTRFDEMPEECEESEDDESIVYSIWDDEGKLFLYVGRSGPQKKDKPSKIKDEPPKIKDKLSRIRTHASGRRSGDQFCIYVQDYFVIPELRGDNYKPARGELDRLTKCYIHANLSYRLKIIQNDSDGKKAIYLEKIIKQGVCGKKPLLNGEGGW